MAKFSNIKIFADGSIAEGTTNVRARIRMNANGRRFLHNDLIDRVVGIDVGHPVHLEVTMIWHDARLRQIVTDALNND